MKCFISGKETKNKTKGVPVHRDHREEFKEFRKQFGNPYNRGNSGVDFSNLPGLSVGDDTKQASAPTVRSNAREQHA